MKPIIAYMAHTLNLRYDVLANITPIVRKVGIRDVNPFYTKNGKASRKEVAIADELTKKGINPRENKEWMERVKKKSRWIVHRDLKMIEKTDIVVAFMKEASSGTVCEIFYAGMIKRKPVFLLTNPDSEIFRHPWLNESCKLGCIVTSLNELEVALHRFVIRVGFNNFKPMKPL